ncbi:hypothetical protein [Rhodococcus jostii]|uniref:hypothetical protein n=1 Tax=Rhodococcus jostii TaxID=132919 RepID=UPI00115FBD46|nr:hypothetical protein [Rhodococcus jostii]
MSTLTFVARLIRLLSEQIAFSTPRCWPNRWSVRPSPPSCQSWSYRGRTRNEAAFAALAGVVQVDLHETWHHVVPLYPRTDPDL